jgi:hypothetical protein
MKLRLLWIIALIIGISIKSSFASNKVDCSPLDPREKVSKEKEAQISASVNTLFKIAKAHGEVKGKIKDEIQNLQQGVPLSEQGIIKLRALYLFCGMFANDNNITPKQKVEFFNTMMNLKDNSTPSEQKSSSKKTSKKTSTGTTKHSEQATRPTGSNAQTVINISSNNQTGGITAKTVNINLIKEEHDKKSRMFDETQLQLRKKKLGLNEQIFISELYDKRQELNNDWLVKYEELTKINNDKIAKCESINKQYSVNKLKCGELDVNSFDEAMIKNKLTEIKDQLDSIDNSLKEFKVNSAKIIESRNDDYEINFNKLKDALDSKELTLEENKFKLDLYNKRSKLIDLWLINYNEYVMYNILRGSSHLYDDKLTAIADKKREIQKHIESIDESLTQLDQKKRVSLSFPPLPPGRLSVLDSTISNQ